MAVDSPEYPPHKSRITRRGFLVGAGAAAAAGVTLYGATAGRHDLEVIHVDIPIRNLPDPFINFRIVQISDIHVDQFTDPAFIARAVTQVNELAPDLVALTGDFVCHGPLPNRYGIPEAGRCAALLSALTCPQRYAILGNHDTTVSAGAVVEALRGAAIPTLVDSRVPVERDGKRLWLCGVNDPLTEEARPDLAVPEKPDGPVILMAHEPDYVDKLLLYPGAQSIDLVLSGHSHGGQICLPGGRTIFTPPMGKKYVHGHFQFGHVQLYVNRGLGEVGLPIRLNCPPEITVLTLKPDTRTI